MPTNWENKLPVRWESQREEIPYWTRRLEIARCVPTGGISLGANLQTGFPACITPEALRTHMQIVGSTGVGKSFLMEALIKTLILQGNGIAVIDPHGDLYHRILAFCAWLARQKPRLQLHRRVIPFDVAETRNIIGFNPIARNARVMTYQVVALMEAIRKCWGQASFQDTPRLARWLFNVAYALIAGNVTFIQAQHLVNPGPSALRTALTGRISNPRIRAEWDWLEHIKPDKREERIESTLNRIRPFVEHEIIRPILGQYTNTLDFPSILSEKKILLVNLARQNAISEDNQHLLGTLLVNELLTAGFARPVEKRIPFYLAIDEFSHFVTKDACEILDGGRKYGLHLILAHQHLGQLKEKDAEVYFSTLTNARTKVVFGGLNDEDVDLIAKELFTGELDPDQIKDEIWHRGFEPVETTRTIHSSSSSSSSGHSDGSANFSSGSKSEIYIPGSDLWSTPTLTNYGEATANSSGHSHSDHQALASTTSETTVPFYEFHEYEELTSRTFRSLEEQLYIKKAALKRQPNQHAAVLIPEQPVQFIKVATLRELPVNERQCQDFKHRCFDAAGCYKTPEDAEAELAALENKLLMEAQPRTTVVSDAPRSTDEGEPKSTKPLRSIWNRTQGRPRPDTA